MGGGGCFRGVGVGKKIKVAHNDLKHILVLKFLKSDEIFLGVGVSELTDIQASVQANLQTL